MTEIINPVGISWKELYKIAEKSSFVIKEGKKHTKILSNSGEFITLIPRHNSIKREIAKSILRQFIKFGADIKLS